jgi:hypothetical protein
MANPYRFGTFTRRVTTRGFRLLNSFGVLPPLPGFAWRNENDFARIEKNGGRISQAKRDELRGMLDRYDQIEACRKQARSDRVRDEQKVYLWQPNSHDALSAWSKHCEHLTKQLNC